MQVISNAQQETTNMWPPQKQNESFKYDSHYEKVKIHTDNV